MTIGAALFLMAVGAILTFAVHVTISGLNIAVIGVVLMLAGAVGIAVELAVFAPRRRRLRPGEAVIDPSRGPSDVVYEEEAVVPPAVPVRRYARRRARTVRTDDYR